MDKVRRGIGLDFGRLRPVFSSRRALFADLDFLTAVFNHLIRLRRRINSHTMTRTDKDYAEGPVL
jgi:hypothetical protein